jgi:hypothetical protein
LAATAAIGLLAVTAGAGSAQAAQRGGLDYPSRAYFVTDSNHTPVGGATVQFTPQGGGAPISKVTESEAGSVVFDTRVLTEGAVYTLQVLPPSGGTLEPYDGGTAAWTAGDNVFITLAGTVPDTYGPFFWVHTPSDPTDRVTVSVPAGGDFFVTGPVNDITGFVNPELVITFESPAPPPPSSSGGVGSGGGMGTAGGTPIVVKTIPDTGDAWSTRLTVPATTTPGGGYNVCVLIRDDGGMGDLGCSAVTVLPVADSTTPTPTPSSSTPASTGTAPAPVVKLASTTAVRGGTVSFTGTGFTPGEKVNVVAHSTPVLLGWVTANASGAVSGSVKVPASFPVGAHTLELQGVTSGATVSASFTVGTVPSAATDMVARSTGATPGAALLVLLASVITVGLVWRRRRAAS